MQYFSETTLVGETLLGGGEMGPREGKGGPPGLSHCCWGLSGSYLKSEGGGGVLRGEVLEYKESQWTIALPIGSPRLRGRRAMSLSGLNAKITLLTRGWREIGGNPRH